MTSRSWKLVLVLGAAAVVVVVGVLLAGAARGLALYTYLLFVGTVALAVIVGRIRSALPPARMPEAPRVRGGGRSTQLQQLERRLAAAQSTTFDLHYRLRPVVREIASARLARGYGVDLEREPDRARALVGDRTWELVRPERQPPDDRFASGWRVAELAALIDELEAI